MEGITQRLNELLNALEIKKRDFAKTIGISEASTSTMFSGKTKPSNSTINVICREFRVNEQWLREGVGQMFEELSIEDEVDAFCGDVKRMPEDDPRRTIMRLLARLDESEWESIASMIEKLKEEQ